MNKFDLTGQQIDQYLIEKHLARGGMANVYRARDVALQRPVAIKVLLGGLAYDEQFIRRFQREAQTVAQLNHPGIVQIYGIGEVTTGQPYIAMQYVAGGSLRDKLRELAERRKLLTTEQALNIAREMAAALQVAHRAGIVHRDLKPSNVLIQDDGRPIIVDLGIAARDDGLHLTQSGQLVGTPHYMSPEQGLGREVDGRSDIYSLGIILYEMLGGQTPFNADSAIAVIQQHISQSVPNLEAFRDGLHPSTLQLVDRCLQKQPENRFSDAGELINAIDNALQMEVNSGANPGMTSVLTHLSDSQLLSRQRYVHGTGTARLRTPITPPPQYVPHTPQYATPGTVPRAAVPQQPAAQTRSMRGFWLVFTAVLITGAAFLGGWFLFGELTQEEPPPPPSEAAETVEEVAAATTSSVETDPGQEAEIVVIITPTAEPSPTSTPLPPTATATSEPTAVPPTLPPPPEPRLVFQSNRDGDFEIFIMDLSGGNQQQLTFNNFDDNYPVVSPQGDQILFQSQRDGNNEIYVMAIDGTAQRRLTNHPGSDRLPTWAPDGRQLAFISDRDGDFELFKMNIDGSGLTQITFNDSREGHVSWSANDQLVFNSGTDNGLTWEIFTIDANGQNLRRLTNNSISDWSPEWSPDGSEILYLSTVGGDPAIFRMNADGSNSQLVYNTPGYEWGADWSPRGDQIAFTIDAENIDTVYVANRDGTAVRVATNRGSYPSWVLPSPITSAGCVLTIGQTVTAADNARLWNLPDVKNGTVSASLPPGSRLTVAGGPIWGPIRTDSNDADWWWQVNAADSSGWIWQARVVECQLE